jgi:phosphoglycerate dehydrogenase-like enzyme
MPVTVLYPEDHFPNDKLEQDIFGVNVTVRARAAKSIAELAQADCDDVEGLMIMRLPVSRADMARFPKLKCIVRMGVGYDRLDRVAAAERSILICNVPDYGTTEVADHAIALGLSLRRGIIHYHDTQRASPVAPWKPVTTGGLVRRAGVQTFGVVGLGRIGTAAALRAKALGFRVAFFDPNLPNGSELAIGVERARTLEALLEQTDLLSIHCPLTKETRGLIGGAALARLKPHAVLVNTARGGIVDLDGVYDTLKSGHLAAAGLDVVPVEPPVDPVHKLMAAYRAREPWLIGRLVFTPHSAFYSPEAEHDTRVKAAETMRAALLSNRPQNVITPDMD